MNFSTLPLFCLLATALILPVASAVEAGPFVLYDFEDPAELNDIRAASDSGIYDIVQDNGVTRGKNCLRMVIKGTDLCAMGINNRDKLAAFAKYDYFAMDAYNGTQEDIDITVEFSDVNSKNYQTRCSFLSNKAHPGPNRLVYRIDQLKRNNKEGRSWEELEPQDKIRRDALKIVKIMVSPPAKQSGDTKLWIDNLCLLPESMANPALKIQLPKGALAFKFGNKSFCPAGFTPVGASALTGADLQEAGAGWPDNLTGNGVSGAGEFSYPLNVPKGRYLAWLSAARLFDGKRFQQPYLLKLGSKALLEEKLSEREFFGEKGIFRFMRTQYSERTNALWLDYVEPEAQEFTGEITVDATPPRLSVSNLRLAALILVPAEDASGFKELCANIRKERIALFTANSYVKPQTKPKKPAGAGTFTLWFPQPQEVIRPWSDPAAQKGDGKACQWTAAQGENVIQSMCVTAWQDLGMGELTISDLKGPATIPAASLRKYYMNYRLQEGSVTEMSLLPWTRIRFEPGITWAYWTWLRVPADAAPGTYAGSISFKSDQGGETRIPLKLTVLPFKLRNDLPVSYGMYYGPWDFAPSTTPEGFASTEAFSLNLVNEQFTFMREIGFTGVSLLVPDLAGGDLRTERIAPYWQAVKAAGFGANPAQKCMGSQLSIARSIGRRTVGAKVDQNPGCELQIGGFKDSYMAAMRKYKTWVDETKLPVAMEVVDEPREVPNPWNRNRDDTSLYGDWLKEIGFDTFVTFMGDVNSGKDYTTIVDHINIVSIHAWEHCAKLLEKARQAKKELWLYNVGMDRLSWGFYNWANDSKGRWEWHFSYHEGGSAVGHPNPNEWYTPFTNLTGYASHAPYFEVKGGMTFRTEYLSVADGITDYAYICTLEQAIASNTGKPAKAVAVKQAQDFLASVRKAIPTFLSTKGMVSPDQGALVGKGLDTPRAAMTEAWRAKVADLITQLR